MMSGSGSSLSEPWKAMADAWASVVHDHYQESTKRDRQGGDGSTGKKTRARQQRSGKLFKFDHLPPRLGIREAMEAGPLGAADGHRQGVRGVAGPALPPGG